MLRSTASSRRRQARKTVSTSSSLGASAVRQKAIASESSSWSVGIVSCSVFATGWQHNHRTTGRGSCQALLRCRTHRLFLPTHANFPSPRATRREGRERRQRGFRCCERGGGGRVCGGGWKLAQGGRRSLGVRRFAARSHEAPRAPCRFSLRLGESLRLPTRIVRRSGTPPTALEAFRRRGVARLSPRFASIRAE